VPAVDELKKAEGDNVEIIWRSFELRPPGVALPEATSDYFKKMWEQNIYPLADKLGVKMKMPTVKPYSRITHEASKWAESKGKSEAFKEAVFRAYFERSENIGEIETILSIAENLRLDTDSLQKALAANEFLEKVLDDEMEAEMIGINSVPAFVADRKNGLAGLQPFENLKRLIGAV
jgi:predicted DsbA family dithiol-disulfide isomerase